MVVMGAAVVAMVVGVVATVSMVSMVVIDPYPRGNLSSRVRDADAVENVRWWWWRPHVKPRCGPEQHRLGKTVPCQV